MYDRFPTKSRSSRKWIPAYLLAGTNRSHYAARSSLILMARCKSDRFATCASNSHFHARSQIALIFRGLSTLIFVTMFYRQFSLWMYVDLLMISIYLLDQVSQIFVSYLLIILKVVLLLPSKMASLLFIGIYQVSLLR